MKILFYLRFHTAPGESLQLVGNFQQNRQQKSETHEMTFLNADFWELTIDTTDYTIFPIDYHYQLISATGGLVKEWGGDRIITAETNRSSLHVIDTWNYAGEYENAFYTAPFENILLPKHDHKKHKQPKQFTHIFKVKAPLLRKNEVLCIGGAGAALGDWQTDDLLRFHKEDNWYTARINLPKEEFPLNYKYGIYNTKTEKFDHFESGDNRLLFGQAEQHDCTIIHDGFARFPNNSWKGAGIAIPVFSLRSKSGFGVGEFNDLQLLADWAEETDLKLIQLLPVNDTTATNSWTDSYPYAAISAFALHPIFIHLEKVAGKQLQDFMKPHKKLQKELNDLPVVDYEKVLSTKLILLHELFQLQKTEIFLEKEFADFFSNNQHWLIPYAAFCYLRDKNNTADFTKWKQHSVYDAAAIEKFVGAGQKHYEHLQFHYFVQYHLHLQLKEATNYAHKKGIVLKGDIPIGIYRFSCDAWMAPELYHMDQQAGAPPDDFAVKGQNWGFPTYNWSKMQEDGFAWWKQRFAQMREYFDAFRIDHILGFFRIWSIPIHHVQGIMGHFAPAIPVHRNEFQERNIWFEYHRYTQPFITEQILWDRFGNLTLGVQRTFLDATGYGEFIFKEEFNTQRKIETWFEKQALTDENEAMLQGLYDLHANVILFEAAGSARQQFHFRFGMENTSSFRALEWDTQTALKNLYVDYFYRRQDAFWMKEALQKLPALKASTNMLICGEDLGMVPTSVPAVMQQLGILSLEIQRMPKDPAKEFFHPNDAPYLSVVTPSTHDMSTIRGWWQEDRQKTRRFFNLELGQWGDAPEFCAAWINKAIVIQHLYSPAMWSIFQLQDLLGIDEDIRRTDPEEERINIPSVAKHYWQYRMHLTIEALSKEKTFNHHLRGYIKASGRH
jgi:4-alpha-glucanotransferase